VTAIFATATVSLIADSEEPGNEAQFERAIVTNAVTSRVCGSDKRDHRFQSRRLRQRHGMLRSAFLGATCGTNRAVAPRLRSNPHGGVMSIRRIVLEKSPVSLGAIPPADTLHDENVAARHKLVRALRTIGTGVRSAHENSGKTPGFCDASAGRAIDVRGQANTVPHGHHYVFCGENFVWKFCLRTGQARQSGAHECETQQKRDSRGRKVILKLDRLGTFLGSSAIRFLSRRALTQNVFLE